MTINPLIYAQSSSNSKIHKIPKVQGTENIQKNKNKNSNKSSTNRTYNQ